MTQKEKEPHEPYYVYIARVLRKAILNGEYLVGDQLPSEAQLCKTFGVSRMTARLAVSQLVDENRVDRVQGRGAFVTSNVIARNSDSLVGFHEDMLKLGLSPNAKIVHFEKRLSNVKEQKQLQLTKADEVFVIHRVRFLGDSPLGLQHLTVPSRMTPNLEDVDLESASFYGILRDQGTPITSAKQRIEAVRSPETAALIGSSEDSSFLRIDRVSYTQNDVPVESLVSWFLGERFAYEMTLRV